MQTVRAPMVGRVVEILVPPKQACQAGETLVVLEAMKMEYRLTAPADGTVQAVLCQVGDWVELDAAVVQVHCAQPADEADEPPARAVK
jgi:biotin carboxyl carrier protein